MVLCAPKSVVPWGWFDDAVEWHQELARRWKLTQHINLSEYRSILVWQEAVSHACLGRGLDFLDLGDNQVAIAVWSRGRSSRWPLNQLARRKAAIELISGIRILPTYFDTSHQPTDGGTRPVRDRLQLDRPSALGAAGNAARGVHRSGAPHT